MSDASMAEKFGRKFRTDKAPFKFGADFEVEGYLHNRGDTFVKRFDANSYLYITKAIDYFNILNGHSLGSIFKGLNAKVLGHRLQIRLALPNLSVTGNRESLQTQRRRRKLLRNQRHLRTRLLPRGNRTRRATNQQFPKKRQATEAHNYGKQS